MMTPLYILVGCFILLRSTLADNCAINFYGGSYVGLNAQTPSLLSSDQYSQHTIEVWANPSRFVSNEQTILQTGIVDSGADISWAVELKFKLTIWQNGHKQPTSSVLYIDVWTTQDNEIWTKIRYYVILGEGDFPWVHISFTPPPKSGSGTILINEKRRRMDTYTPVSSSDIKPSPTFAIGAQFYGAVDEVRIWKAPQSQSMDVSTSLCLSDIDADTLLYFPFNECSGDVFAGYNQEGIVCAMMYGSYGPTSEDEQKRDEGQSLQSNLVWTTDSVVTSRECTPVLVDQCDSAVRVVDKADSNADEPAQDVAVWIVSFPGPGLLLAIAAVLILIFIVAGIKSKETNEVTQC